MGCGEDVVVCVGCMGCHMEHSASHTDTVTHNGAGHLLDGGDARVCPLPVKKQDQGEDPECVYASVCLMM